MNAVVVTRFGGPDGLAVLKRPDPKPGPGEVVVRVAAAALNPLDAKMMHGDFRLIYRQKPPYVPGFEVAGVVESVGEGVDGAIVGERVVTGTARGRGLAERVVVSAGALARLPARISFEDAAGIPAAGCTALQGLRAARLRSGGRVLVNGASGGVGTLTLQIARAMGATVDATCSARNAELVRGLGAERVYDYAREDFAAGAGLYDVIYDAVGTRGFADCRRVLKPGGAFATTLPNGRTFLDLALTLVAPFAFGGRRIVPILVRPNAKDVATILLWVDEGKVRPILDRVVPLEEGPVREAFAHLESGRARGKIVVRIGSL